MKADQHKSAAVGENKGKSEKIKTSKVSGYVDEDEQIQELLSKLTVKQKVSLLSGQDFWRTAAIPEHGIPPLKVTDGPNGARGEFFVDGTPAALFPCGVSLAATWNVELLRQVGNALAAEAKSKQAQMLLAPTVCMHRSPLGGRNFESFSEDPYFTGKMASSYIIGLQERGVGATIKHFVANEQETWRMHVNVVVDERPLREIYLKPFEIAVREAKPWAVMSSYNLINGKHADMNDFTLNKVLRGEWNYDGAVVSDWGGTNSTVESIKCGLDLEMPGPGKYRGQKVLDALESGELTLEDIERCAARVLRLVKRSGRFDMPLEEPAEEAINTQETRDLIRSAGSEGIVLLKNENNALPISDVRKIALIGPNVKQAICGGGGSSSLKPHYLTTPFESITALSGKEIIFAEGAQIHKWLPLASSICVTEDGKPGVTLEFYKGDSFQGNPLVTQHRASTDLILWDSTPEEVGPEFSIRVKTFITAEVTGQYSFGITSVGPARLFIDGTLLIDNWNWSVMGETMFESSIEATKDIYLEAGQKISILVESTNEIRPKGKVLGLSLFTSPGQTHSHAGVRIGYAIKPEKDLIAEAVEAATSADVAVIIVGLNAEWESEGYDRQTMDLPKNGVQDALISAVVKANPRTIVVNKSGTPVTMPWADQVPAIIQAWYQGQEAGNALADVLLGTVNPSGKLPVTFPVRLEDNPSYHNWPGEDMRVLYGEGLFIGYRHYERVNVKPLFPFGHGLSYTTFSYGSASISSAILTAENELTISIPVTNSGLRTGKEIVQLYIRDVESRLPRPKQELQGFVKVELDAGETKVVEFKVSRLSVGYFDASIGKWIAEKGAFEAVVAASSVDVKDTVKFEVEESFTWIF